MKGGAARYLLGAVALLLPVSVGSAQTVVRQIPTPVTAAGAGSGVVLAAGVNQVESIDAVNGATAGFAVLYDSATLPADGALTPGLVKWCMPIGVNTGISDNFRTARQFYNGVTFFISTGSCTTKTVTAHGYVGVQVP